MVCDCRKTIIRIVGARGLTVLRTTTTTTLTEATELVCVLAVCCVAGCRAHFAPQHTRQRTTTTQPSLFTHTTTFSSISVSGKGDKTYNGTQLHVHFEIARGLNGIFASLR